MDFASIRASLSSRVASGFEVYERRAGDYQLIVPICHEDGDMVDIYVQDSPRGEAYVRLCDFGMALMSLHGHSVTSKTTKIDAQASSAGRLFRTRLSYSYELNSDAKRRIFDDILINSRVSNEDGSLCLDVPVRSLYEGVMQFAGCVQKVCNMRYWARQT